MDMLWSASTTMRNPERTLNFLRTIAEMEGESWNHETQKRLQSLLIKNRYYAPTHDNLSPSQIALLDNLSLELSYEQARDIFDSKGYTDPPMRGRTSFDPIEKLGLVCLDKVAGKQVIRTTPLGRMFLQDKIPLEDVIFSNLLKFQFPNPLSNDRRDYDTKPFINTLRLIKRVNELCQENGEKPKGVSRLEFGIFVLSIKSYEQVEEKATSLLKFRYELSNIHNEDETNAYIKTFVEHYLSSFIEPLHNSKEYTDNIIRYLRLTKYVYIRGGGYYIDLEPRRMVEIASLLEHDNGSAKQFTLDEYKEYIGDYYSYELPFETIEKLTDITKGVINEINSLETRLSLVNRSFTIENTIEMLKQQIEYLRNERTLLQNLILKKDYQDTIKIDEVINCLTNIRKLELKPSIALEKWTNIALNIINDAQLIKPNSPLGDDNEPTFTAPSGVPDIECFYGEFGEICEVTMLTSRDQWFNEGQPVMRHLRDFERTNSTITNYCLFIAPSIHVDTINTFWTSVKYEYQGQKQKIIPITISQLIEILKTIKLAKERSRQIRKEQLKILYDACVSISDLHDSTTWQAHISTQLRTWTESMIA